MNKSEFERTQTEIYKLDIYSMTSDEFSRFIVYKQLFGRTYLSFHKLWNIDKSLSETGVHSTRASQSPKYSKVSNVEEYFKEFKEAVGQTEVSVVEKQKNVVDNAAMSKPGGIDLDPSKWNLDERLQGSGADKMLQWTGSIPTSFTPLIISIQPIKSETEFSALMGFSNALAANVVR